MKIKQPTTTSLVLEVLQQADDFMTIEMLKQRTGRNNLGDVRMALIGLHHYHAIDFVADNDGQVWWFATGDDKRSRKIHEIVPDIHRNQPCGVKRPRKLKP